MDNLTASFDDAADWREKHLEEKRGRTIGMTFGAKRKVLTVPDGWVLLPSGDPPLHAPPHLGRAARLQRVPTGHREVEPIAGAESEPSHDSEFDSARTEREDAS